MHINIYIFDKIDSKKEISKIKNKNIKKQEEEEKNKNKPQANKHTLQKVTY